MLFTDYGVVVVNDNIYRLHDSSGCSGDNCVIHKPSEHPLKTAPIWIGDHAYAYRLCGHNGIKHPDPDSREHFRRMGVWGFKFKVIYHPNGKPSTISRMKQPVFRHNKKCDGCCT